MSISDATKQIGRIVRQALSQKPTAKELEELSQGLALSDKMISGRYVELQLDAEDERAFASVSPQQDIQDEE